MLYMFFAMKNDSPALLLNKCRKNCYKTSYVILEIRCRQNLEQDVKTKFTEYAGIFKSLVLA